MELMTETEKAEWIKEFWTTNLQTLLSHGHWNAVKEIVNKASELETHLVALLKDEDEKVREGAIMTLSALDNCKKYFTQIKDALNDPSPRVRGTVAKRIIRVNKKEARTLLLYLLARELDDNVILNIIEALKNVGELNDIMKIARFVKEENRNVANQASDAIRYITSRYWRLPIKERLRRYWFRLDKVTFVETLIFFGILIVGIGLGEWGLQTIVLAGLSFTYIFGLIRRLNPPR